MDPQEITQELEHPGARNLLDSATLLRLAYNGSDGFPRVIPIGLHWNGNQIVVCTAATAPKVKRCRRVLTSYRRCRGREAPRGPRPRCGGRPRRPRLSLGCG